MCIDSECADLDEAYFFDDNFPQILRILSKNLSVRTFQLKISVIETHQRTNRITCIHNYLAEARIFAFGSASFVVKNTDLR